MKLRTLRDENVKGKIVLVRVDYNVPIENGKITSDLRIVASLSTIEYLLKNGAKKVVLISHLGRPEKKIDRGEVAEIEQFSLAPVAARLQKLLGGETVGFYPLPKPHTEVEKSLSELAPMRVALLENLRFDSREEGNAADFAQEIVDFVQPDLFVQDGFAVTHRAHASVDAITKLVPTVAGFLVEKEVTELSHAIENPEHPVLLIIGGAKVEDKQPLIDEFLGKADKIVVGGKIAADGYVADNAKIYVAEDFDEDARGQKLDVGPVACAKIAEMIADAKTIIWNGLMGKAEDAAYATASEVVAKMMGKKRDAETIVCGGDTTGFVENLQREDASLHYSLVSTGGGAALEFLLGKPSPGIENLKS